MMSKITGTVLDAIQRWISSANTKAIRMETVLERHPWRIPILVLILIAAFGWWFAGQRQMWFDEKATMIGAKCSSISSVGIVRMGLDLAPPLFVQMERTAIQVLGSSEQALRFPSIAGILLLLACLFAIFRYWFGASMATIGLLFAAQGVYQHYLVEARAYGPTLGCIGLASLIWQRSETGNRVVKLLALTLVSSLAICMHYYAVYGLVAIGAGQLGRDFSRKRIDYLTWLALIVSVWVLLPHLPLIAGIGAVFGTLNTGTYFNRENSLSTAISMYLYPGTGRLLILFLILVALLNKFNLTAQPIANPRPKTPLEAWTFMIGAASMLPLAFAAAAWMGLQFYPRYVLFSVAGVVGLSLLVMTWRNQAPALVSMVLLASGWPLLLRSMYADIQRDQEAKLPLAWVRDNVNTSFGPILSGDIFTHAVLYHYGPAAGLPRIDAPVSREVENRYRGDGGYFTTFMRLATQCDPTIPTRDWDQLRREEGRFQILLREGERQWVVQESLRLGAQPRLVKQGSGWDLLEVELPPDARK